MDETQKRLLTDEAWQAIAPAFHATKPRRGRPSLCDRQFFDAVRWILRTGAPWRDLPPTLGRWQSAYRRFARWAKCGRWQTFWQALDAIEPKTFSGQKRLCIDSTSVRVHAHGAPPRERNAQERVGRSRGGRTSKVHLACSGSASRPWRAQRAVLSAGHAHDITAVKELLGRKPTIVSSVVADKAYDASWLRSALSQKQLRATIPSRSRRLPWTRKDAREYRHRGLVERAFARIKQFRRTASRFDRLARHFGAFVQIALALSLVGASALPR
ncbi:MAG: IS5 family transposase [Oxalobacteraceae bacterium]|nr:MAG: IS5 family transposase [Oxalobacteraceae bacterium]